MSAPVDVLAVMADNATWAQQVAERGGIPQRVRQCASGVAYQQGLARAAVAELIRTGQALHNAWAHGGRDPSDEEIDAHYAALARIGGAK